ncbi:MAG: hypothetical protein ABEJ02_05030 [Candidatus Paceibacteria bacterium]
MAREFICRNTEIIVPDFLWSALHEVFYKCRGLSSFHERVEKINQSRSIEPKLFNLDEQCEKDRHHKVPKARGGKDNSENIIDPIPRSAHLSFHQIFGVLLPGTEQHSLLDGLLLEDRNEITGRQLELLRESIKEDRTSKRQTWLN